jgi:Domain of unknown function (DUF4157)
MDAARRAAHPIATAPGSAPKAPARSSTRGPSVTAIPAWAADSTPTTPGSAPEAPARSSTPGPPLTAIPDWAAHRPAAQAYAEAEADDAAIRAAVGAPAGITAPPPQVGPSGTGSALSASLRGLLERSLGADLSTVRVHTDATSAAAVRSARARAVTVGEDIALAPGEYRPESPRGTALIAHEVAHVLQQRTTGVRPQFQVHDDPAQAKEDAVWISVTLRGLRVTSPARRMTPGDNALHAYLAVVLHRIAPKATSAQVDTVITRLENAPDTQFEGAIAVGRVIPPGGEAFAPVNIAPAEVESMITILQGLGIDVDLDKDQRRLAHLGAVADTWAPAAVAALKADFPWYSLEIWHGQLDMHTQLLAESVATEEANPSAGQARGRDTMMARLRPPLEVLEAIRTDGAVTVQPQGMNPQQTKDWAAATGMWNLLWGTLPAKFEKNQDKNRLLAIQFYWTAPSLYDPAAGDHGARMDFLRRMANWIGRSGPALDPDKDYTQELIKDPGRYTDKPFPAHLQALPEPTGDLRIVPAHAEHRYRFSVDFKDLFDAFGRYAYRWDVLEWRTDDDAAARKKAVAAIESGRTDADRRTEGRHGTSHTDVLLSRLGRDMAHARADVMRIATTIGPAAVEIAPELTAMLALRTVATGFRTLIDIVTLERGAGVRERMIMVPGPGLWVIRATAVPLFELADEVHRAPSVAYIPVYAVPQEKLAEQALADAVRARADDEKNRMDARKALLEMAGPDSDPTLRAMAQRLADDPRLGTDRWAALEATQKELESLLKQVEQSIDAVGTSSSDLALLRVQRDALERQIKRNKQTLGTHGGRVEDYPELAHAQSLTAQLVTDDGQTVPLTLEWAEIPWWEAETTLAVGAGAASTIVIVSDHTHPNAGMAQGSGPTADRAVRNALTTLLESRDGYGRGLVAVKLPSGSSQTFRIEASLGQLLNETLDDMTTLVTIAALAAAPFTAGASLSVLVPVGVVSGIRAAERMYSRYDASTLRWDLQTLQDFVDIASAAVGVGAAVKGAKAGMQVSRIGRLAAISFDIGSNATGFVILGVRLEDQLREIEETPGISASERRSRRAAAIGGALFAAGMQAASILIPKVYGPHAETPHPDSPDVTPEPVTPSPVPEKSGSGGESPEVHPSGTPHAEGPQKTQPKTEQPALTPKTEKPPATPEEQTPAPKPDAVPEPDSEQAPKQENEPKKPASPPGQPAPAAAPASIDDLIGPRGLFKPEYPELAEGWRAYAEKSRSGGVDPLTPREWALRVTRGQLAKALNRLLPSGWRRGQRAIYPGGRPDAVALDVASPQPGTPVAGTSKKWSRRVVRTEDLTPRMDNAGERYWLFPDLRPGEVLVLPNGSRVWIDPVTGEIVDRAPVGPSISSERASTRGEEIMFAASDRSPEHEAAKTERAHGATQPGMGGDAPYSIAGAPRKLNQGFERSGIEMWVRRLGHNAEPGVTYVYTTRTRRSARGDLLSRRYEVAALDGGKSTTIASFDIEMRGGGITDADVELTGWDVNAAAMDRYGAPEMKKQPKSKPPGGDVSAHIPPELAEWVRGGAEGKEPRVRSPLTPELEAAQQARARLGDLAMRAGTSGHADPGTQRAMAELDDALLGATERVSGGPADAEASQQLAALVRQINELARIRTRFDRLTVEKLTGLTEMLNQIAVH